MTPEAEKILRVAEWKEPNGTSLLGIIETTYAELVRVFGPQHNDGDGDKVRAEWDFVIKDSDPKIIFTIYDWKESRPKHLVTEWHFGGFNQTGIEASKALATLGFRVQFWGGM
jgi:hypothetical protein